MPLTEDDFASVKTLVERIISDIGQPFVTGKVIKRDEARSLIWLAEVGDQPIPCVAFNFNVSTYPEVGGKIVRRDVTTKVIVPKVGATVLVAFERGTRRLPRCIGEIQSLDYIQNALQEPVAGGGGGGSS